MRQPANPSSLWPFPAVLRLLAPGLLLAAAAFVAGCGGGPKDVVSGTVKTKKGDKVQGQIIFRSSDGKEASGGILDGKYKIENVPKGDLDVIIKGSPGAGSAGPKPVIPNADKGEKPEVGGAAAAGGVAPNKKYETAGALPKFKFDGGKKENVDFELDP